VFAEWLGKTVRVLGCLLKVKAQLRPVLAGVDLVADGDETCEEARSKAVLISMSRSLHQTRWQSEIVLVVQAILAQCRTRRLVHSGQCQ